jgi:uncharacterized protein YecE (DUF72 family)
MTRFWVGVSGFSYASWKGVFYPEKTPLGKMLEAYASKLNSVEINSSFYHMPTQATTAKWAGSTQPDFRFSFKANRKITHFMKLKGTEVELEIFLKGLKPLEDRLGCVLVQLPPYMKQDYDTLEAFLKQKPERTRFAMEFRHSSWFGDELKKLLSKYNVALCVADTEEMKPIFERTARFSYVRLRQNRYSRIDLKKWTEKLSNFADDLSDCFIYFMHDETGGAANMAASFLEMLGP